MDNQNAKTDGMMNVQKHGFGQDFILVRDYLLYVRGNETFNLDGFETPGVHRLKSDHRLPEDQVAYLLSSLEGNAAIPDLGDVLSRHKASAWKKSFLVFKNQKYTTVQTDNIAFFYIRNNAVSMMCFDKQVYTLSYSLDQITGAVSPQQFFRINRQYIVNFNAIKEVELYYMRKLCVKLIVEAPDQLLINKEKTTGFLAWMENR
ncbi:LytR/AlgR family response regulator transcription factor [Deminuibacter soli]|uniref:LytTR family transcriptional regulator n=1 Tax=Deminuibacter soli TaxID=2291815 RepID=A0A3E1NLP6_9BACT|nr:LytTR family DNA-binding domain-containing protein [Deminuibacter soli]RFM28718.1 LytTR family transcriptional regulator [Deminuibacter soli]